MAFRAWQQRLPLALSAEHRALPRRAGDTAETITAMAEAWMPFGGCVSVEAFPDSNGFHIHDAFVRPLPSGPAGREDFDLGRDPATGNLLARVTLHAVLRLAHPAPALTNFVRLFPSRFGWSAYTIPADTAVVSLAALDLQLSGDPTLTLWHLATTDCPARCLNHAEPAAPTRAGVTALAAPDWTGLPPLRWPQADARPAPLDPSVPGTQRHPFFEAPEPEHTLRCHLDVSGSDLLHVVTA